MVHKLLSEENISYQNKVAEALTRGLRSHHEGITTNPMLITYFIENFRKIMRYHRMDFRLNREIYDILLFGHDELKKFFNRKFQVVSSPDEFTAVFRKFCAMTYLDRVFELSPNEFDKNFNKLKTELGENKYPALTPKGFLSDIYSIACMMYARNMQLYYLDPILQAYMFADYCLLADEDELTEIGKKLWNVFMAEYPLMTALICFTKPTLKKLKNAYVCLISGKS